ncbi:MAG: hypothetical protein U9O56_03585 [Campylobacterota bacterium]|nr:hypothetical protein [Campylobacterota bacterium]
MALIYLQLIDYKNITNDLISINTKQDKTNQKLDNELKIYQKENNYQANKIEKQAIKIEELTQKIISLEENLTRQKLQIQKSTFIIPTPTINYQEIPVNDINNTQFLNNEELDISPKLFFDDQQNIDGFHIELKQKF